MPSSKTPRHGLNRRKFIGTAGTLAGLGTTGMGSAWAAGASERLSGSARGGSGGGGTSGGSSTGPLEAYASATSVRQGGAISFHARAPFGQSTRYASYPTWLARVGSPDETLMTGSVKLRKESVPSDASTRGCNWPVSFTLTIPTNWPSGLYYVGFGTGSQVCMVPFVVRPATPTAGAKVLVQVPVTTPQAYNNYGGQSLYDYNSRNGVRASQVSFNRPFANPFLFAFDRWQATLARWLAKNGIAADYCTNIDMHQEAGLLTPYRLWISAGHDEYWTHTMRDRLDAFVAAGGNAAMLGGNACWFQVRLEDTATAPARTMVCYKSASADPVPDAGLKTFNWISLTPPWPENATLGLGSRNAAAWTNTSPRPDTPFQLQRPDHWVFEGAGLAPGARFAGAYVGYETGACETVRGSDGLFYPTASDATPQGVRVLAQADANGWDAAAKALGYPGEQNGWATMATFSRGGTSGTVFNVGSTDWVFGLQPELDGTTPTPVSRITQNVVRKLSTAFTEVADVRQWRGLLVGGGTRSFHTTGFDAPAGTALDGVVFAAHLQPAPGSVPVYRWRRARPGGDGYLYALSQQATPAANWTLDQVAFHAYAAANSSNQPVYQLRQTLPDGQLSYSYTASLPNPLPAGSVNDGVVFYAPLG